VGVIWGVLNSGPVLGLLLLTLIPVAVTVAILRHRLLDIRVVVSRALLYGLLTAAAVGAYAGLVALLDLMVRSQVSFGVAVAASIVVAFGFNPARVRLQRLIDRALYGDRRDPVRAVSLVGERLAGTGTAAATGLPGVLEARNADIARRMSIAPKTVANHISAIFVKLQVTDRGEAIVMARDAGLGRGGPGVPGPG
jgi:hypothetical protein